VFLPNGARVAAGGPARLNGFKVMTLDRLRAEVLAANLVLVRHGLVTEAYGNASGIDRDRGLVVIKPSGVDYADLTADQLVVTDLDGRTVEGPLHPSSDLPTHLALYRGFAGSGGVVHTHSRFATSWAQAGREIPCLGTTHADRFPGAIPVTAPLQSGEIQSAYEHNTGVVIVRRFAALDPLETTAVLVHGHGPFCWGTDATTAAHTAILLEEVARMAYYTTTLNPSVEPISDALRMRHFRRKHGTGAYYGQESQT
jgi:L-ribulose-5-phosphate 4-epimerase